MENQILISVLKGFENWLKENPATRYVRLHDAALSPGEQGKETDIFRIKCLVMLARLADELTLDTLLVAITDPDPDHIPRVV